MQNIYRKALQFLMVSAVCTIPLQAALAQSPSAASAGFSVTSPRHSEGAFLDKRFAGPTDERAACWGENVSLPLQWTNAPANTMSVAIILYDIEGGGNGPVVHWIGYGIAPDATGFAEGEGTTLSSRFVGGTNNRGLPTYVGPCAPAADTPHHYIYTVYALNVPKEELPAGLTRDQFLDKVKGRILVASSLVSVYKRPK